MAKKNRISFRDHLTAYLVMLVIVSVILMGAFALYMSGIFDPVVLEGTPLADTTPLELATAPPPRAGLLDVLIPSACAQEAQTPIIVTPAPPVSEDELTALLDQIVSEEGGEPDIPPSEQITLRKDDLSLNANLPDGVYNVLLLATDSRSQSSIRGRSDVNIIASLDMQAGQIKLTSISRDLWVPIHESVDGNKLNAAFAFGGPELAMKTVNETFEMNISDYVVVDIPTMAGIVDTLGGVTIHLEGMEYAYINYNVAVSEDYEGFEKSGARRPLTAADAGTDVQLDGLQAVSYARIRKLDNDIKRGSRQRILLQAMMDKATQNLSLSTFYGLATNLMNSTTTNIKLTTVMEIGTWLLSGDGFPSMSELSIPIPGSYRGDTEKEMSVIKFSREENVRALHEFLYGEYIPASKADAP